jgi:RND family efflux transporter MFP subunit
MTRAFKIALPVVVLGGSILIAVALLATGPEAQRRKPPPAQPTVEVMVTAPQTYQVDVRTRGTVSPRTQSTLVPEVAGRIVEVAASFRNGGFFDKGDVLATIDPRDYEIAVTIARSELAQARLKLREEEAQAEQARQDWKKLGGGAEPTALVLRKPQMASARAAVAAAEGRLRQAEIDLQRTRVRAPYVGRVLEKSVDIGQYVAQGTVMATIYAVDYVEIRLPLTDEQQAFVDLPELYRGEGVAPEAAPKVVLTARIGGKEREWEGRIVRTEGAIDTKSRQLFAVAQVDDPYGRHGDRPPLKVGQFVQARIQGRHLDNAFVIPRGAVRGDSEVFVVDDADRLRRRKLDIAWRDAEHVVVIEGLAPNERISLTPLPFAADGVQVRIAGAPSDDAGARQARVGASGDD